MWRQHMIHTVKGSDAGSFLQADWADFDILIGSVHVDMGMCAPARDHDWGIVAPRARMRLFCNYLSSARSIRETLLLPSNHARWSP